jgi:hypothetical protein
MDLLLNIIMQSIFLNKKTIMMIVIIFFLVISTIYCVYYIEYTFVYNNITQDKNILDFIINNNILLFKLLPKEFYISVTVFCSLLLLYFNTLLNKINYDNKNDKVKYIIGCSKNRINFNNICYYLLFYIFTSLITLLIFSRNIINSNMLIIVILINIIILLITIITYSRCSNFMFGDNKYECY